MSYHRQTPDGRVTRVLHEVTRCGKQRCVPDGGEPALRQGLALILANAQDDAAVESRRVGALVRSSSHAPSISGGPGNPSACGSGLFGVARRLAHSARRTVLHLNNTGRWTDLQLHMINALRALPAPAS